MNLFEFDFYDDTEKAKIINDYGILVAERQAGRYSFELYQFETFYVERQLETKTKVFKRYYCFADTFYIEPYLPSIDIRNLVY